MTLSIKILGILLSLIGLTALLDLAVHRWVIYPNFAAMEKLQAKKDLAHYLAVLRAEMAHLDDMAIDWAAGRDAPGCVNRMIDDSDDACVEPRAFLDNGLNLIARYDPAGNLANGRAFDPRTGLPVPLKTFNALFQRTPRTNRFGYAGADSSTLGFFPTAQGPMLLAVRAIHSGGNGRHGKGSLVIGRLLSAELPELSEFRIQADHQIWSMSGARLAAEEQEATRKITPRSPFFIRAKKRSLQAYATIPDVNGIPLLLVRVEITRKESAWGLAALKYAGMSDALVSGAFLIVLFSLLQRTVIRPIRRLRQHADAIRDGHESAAGCFGDRRDEIGALCRQFESLRQRLRSMHRNLLQEVDEHRRSQEILDTYHAKLRRLSSELLLAQESERRRIAVELHDRIGQCLTISKMKVDALSTDHQPAKAEDALRQISAMLENAIADTRTLSFELSPPVLYDFGLAAALEWLADKFGREHDLHIAVETPAVDVPGNTRAGILLFQAARELLFNIVKHAGASAVKIRLNQNGRMSEICIADNGRGFVAVVPEPGRAEHGGFGLFSIRERLNDLGGRLHIDSAPGKGASVTLVCPLAGADQGDRPA